MPRHGAPVVHVAHGAEEQQRSRRSRRRATSAMSAGGVDRRGRRSRCASAAGHRRNDRDLVAAASTRARAARTARSPRRAVAAAVDRAPGMRANAAERRRATVAPRRDVERDRPTRRARRRTTRRAGRSRSWSRNASYTRVGCRRTALDKKAPATPGASSVSSTTKCLRLRHFLFVILQLLDGDVRRPSRASSFDGLNTGTGRADTSTGEPVRGLRAMRVLRWRILNVPKPRTSMFFCSCSASLIDVEERVDDASAVLLGDHRPSGAGNLGGDSLDQVGFGH